MLSMIPLPAPRACNGAEGAPGAVAPRVMRAISPVAGPLRGVASSMDSIHLRRGIMTATMLRDTPEESLQAAKRRGRDGRRSFASHFFGQCVPQGKPGHTNHTNKSVIW